MSFLKKVKIIAGQGAGVTVHLVDCTVMWDEDKKEFEPTKCHALFTAAYKSVNTKTADEGYSDALEIKLHTPEDKEDLDYSVTIDEKDDLYEIDSTKGLVLSAGWTRAKFSKGDSFEFSVSKNYIDIGGTATFTEDGEYAWSDLDHMDDEED
jgi:hypothetical protein